MKSAFTTLATLAALIALTSTAWAEDEVKASGIDKPNSVNLSPLGALAGSYALNYERLFNGGHGLLIEGVYSSTEDDDTSSSSQGATIGYRWHWNGTQDSWFTGANLGYQIGTGDAVVEATVNGQTTKEKFDVDVKAFTATINIGRRWAWDSGFNVTFRVGAGYGNYDVSTDSDDPLAQDAVQLVDDLLTLIPVAVDGELSIGWDF